MNTDLRDFLSRCCSPEYSDMLLEAEDTLISVNADEFTDIVDNVLFKENNVDNSTIINELDSVFKEAFIKYFKVTYIEINPDATLSIKILNDIAQAIESIPGHDELDVIESILDTEDTDLEAFISILTEITDIDEAALAETIDYVSPTLIESIRESCQSAKMIDDLKEIGNDIEPIISRLKLEVDVTKENVVIDLIKDGLAVGLDFEDYESVLKESIYPISELNVLKDSIIALNAISLDYTNDPKELIGRISKVINDLTWLDRIAPKLNRIGIYA